MPNTIKNSQFKSQTVLLDGNAYEGCTFDDCEMVYSATGPVGLSRNNIINCRWKLDGAAANTVAFLARLYQWGATKEIEGIIDTIRGGSQQPPPSTVSFLNVKGMTFLQGF